MLLFASFGELWELNHKVTFDGANKRIYISDEASELDVKTDIYSSWKEWARVYDNSKYLPCMRVIGGDPVGGGLFAGDIYFMINGWRIVVDHPIQIVGTLYNDEPVSPYIVEPGGGVTAVVSNLAYAVSTNQTYPTSQEIADQVKLVLAAELEKILKAAKLAAALSA